MDHLDAPNTMSVRPLSIARVGSVARTALCSCDLPESPPPTALPTPGVTLKSWSGFRKWPVKLTDYHAAGDPVDCCYVVACLPCAASAACHSVNAESNDSHHWQAPACDGYLCCGSFCLSAILPCCAGVLALDVQARVAEAYEIEDPDDVTSSYCFTCCVACCPLIACCVPCCLVHRAIETVRVMRGAGIRTIFSASSHDPAVPVPHAWSSSPHTGAASITPQQIPSHLPAQLLMAPVPLQQNYVTNNKTREGMLSRGHSRAGLELPPIKPNHEPLRSHDSARSIEAGDASISALEASMAEAVKHTEEEHLQLQLQQRQQQLLQREPQNMSVLEASMVEAIKQTETESLRQANQQRSRWIIPNDSLAPPSARKTGFPVAVGGSDESQSAAGSKRFSAVGVANSSDSSGDDEPRKGADGDAHQKSKQASQAVGRGVWGLPHDPSHKPKTRTVGWVESVSKLPLPLRQLVADSPIRPSGSSLSRGGPATVGGAPVTASSSTGMTPRGQVEESRPTVELPTLPPVTTDFRTNSASSKSDGVSQSPQVPSSIRKLHDLSAVTTDLATPQKPVQLAWGEPETKSSTRRRKPAGDVSAARLTHLRSPAGKSTQATPTTPGTWSYTGLGEPQARQLEALRTASVKGVHQGLGMRVSGLGTVSSGSFDETGSMRKLQFPGLKKADTSDAGGCATDSSAPTILQSTR